MSRGRPSLLAVIFQTSSTLGQMFLILARRFVIPRRVITILRPVITIT